jgi:NADH dehydrogenase/NADH:ubiquinone oxidoreductase subunit G
MMRHAGSFVVAAAILMMIIMATTIGFALTTYAAKSKKPDTEMKLALELLGHASETEAPVDKNVLLKAARSLVMEAGDVAAVMEALRMIADRFAINLDTARIAALEDMAAKTPAASLGGIADRLLDVAGELENEGDVAKAQDLAESALTAARRGKDRDRQKKAAKRLAEIREQFKLLDRSNPRDEKLAANPGDPEALAKLGRFGCFVTNEWKCGLSHLARRCRACGNITA